MKRSSIVTMTLVAAAVLALGIVAGSVRAEDAKPKPAKAKVTRAAAAGDKAIAAIDAQIAAAKVDKKTPGWKTHLPKPTLVTFDAKKKYYAHMVTNVGTTVIELRPEVAPMHVTNFIYLARLGFYDGLNFHRVLKGFMAQGGDPNGTGSGTPGYGLDLEVKPDVKHDKIGVLSTANTGAPGSDGSQFFIMFVPYPSLDMKYSIFGQVTEGIDVVQKLEENAGSGAGRPKTPLNILSVTIDSK
jgi:peptidyl-prolyl cis-trans isomerase B (cyclophilin B)